VLFLQQLLYTDGMKTQLKYRNIEFLAQLARDDKLVLFSDDDIEEDNNAIITPATGTTAYILGAVAQNRAIGVNTIRFSVRAIPREDTGEKDIIRFTLLGRELPSVINEITKVVSFNSLRIVGDGFRTFNVRLSRDGAISCWFYLENTENKEFNLLST